MSENIYQKLAKVRQMVEVIQKDKAGFNYKYVDITSILARVSLGMRKYKLSLIPSIIPGTLSVEPITFVKTKIDKVSKQPYQETKVEIRVHADMNFRWLNDEDPSEFIDVSWVLSGCQEDPSQALGSALTYCTRQFLTSYFQIAQPENDPDSFRSKQKEAEFAENKAITEEIIKEVDAMIQEFVKGATDEDEARDQVLKLTGKYVKGGNYKKIDNPKLASKLMQEFKEKFMEGKE